MCFVMKQFACAVSPQLILEVFNCGNLVVVWRMLDFKDFQDSHQSSMEKIRKNHQICILDFQYVAKKV